MNSSNNKVFLSADLFLHHNFHLRNLQTFAFIKRNYFLLVCFIQFSLSSFGQQSYLKRPSIGFYFLYNNFYSADYIRSNSLSEGLKNNKVPDFKNMEPGLAIGYIQGISNHFDFTVTASGSSIEYIYRDHSTSATDHFLFELDGSVIGKLLNDKHWGTPYITAGIGLSKYVSDYGLFAPVGIGGQFIFFHEVYLMLNVQYRVPLTALTNYHFYYNLGLASDIGKKKKSVVKPKPTQPVMTRNYDHDRDGIPDSVDACPTIPGLKEYDGCPDSDGDGIPDNKDKCPRVPGIAKYNGCPIPDCDGDGINDEEDSCRLVPGVVRYKGCPIPDSDGDGLNDEIDTCPTIPGVKENQGCPFIGQEQLKQINLDAQNIFFVTGSYKLLSKSFKSLNDVIRILKQNPSLHLVIEGHTDNVGGDVMNQTLSENRALSVGRYLIEEGKIDKTRFKTVGFGATKPVADNKTVKGRALNRRVVFVLNYY